MSIHTIRFKRVAEQLRDPNLPADRLAHLYKELDLIHTGMRIQDQLKRREAADRIRAVTK